MRTLEQSLTLYIASSHPIHPGGGGVHHTTGRSPHIRELDRAQPPLHAITQGGVTLSNFSPQSAETRNLPIPALGHGVGKAPSLHPTLRELSDLPHTA